MQVSEAVDLHMLYVHLHSTESSAYAGAGIYVFLNVFSLSVKTGSHCAALDGLQLTM